MEAGNRRRWVAALAALATGALYALAQPDRGVWPLSAVALIPLLSCLRGRRWRVRLLLGLSSGTLAGALLVVEPTGSALAGYFDLEPLVGRLAAAGLALLFGGMGFAAFAVLLGPSPGPAAAAAAWVVSEWLRSTLATGLPWALLSHSLTPFPPALGLARFGGAWLIGALLVAVNAALLAALRVPARRSRNLMLALALLLALCAPWWLTMNAADLRRSEASAAPAGWLRVALVQPLVPAASRRSLEGARVGLERTAALSPGAVDLVVWPESAVPYVLPENRERLAQVLESVPGPSRWLVGAPRSEPALPGLANAAILVDRDGRELQFHEKLRLVPFTERDPGGLGAFGREGAAAVRPGARAGVVEVAGTTLGPLVCYEVLFASAARQSVLGGAQILVNLTNDEWFATGRGLEQHFAAAVMRAAETGRPLLRAANTGITAAVDGSGVVVARLPADAAGALVVEVRGATGTTPYTRFGDLTLLWAPIWLVLARVRPLLKPRSA